MKRLMFFSTGLLFILSLISCGGGGSDSVVVADPASNIYLATYQGTWFPGTALEVVDSGDVEFTVDANGVISVRSGGHPGIGPAGVPLVPATALYDTFIDNWGSVDAAGVVTVNGLLAGETATISIVNGEISGSATSLDFTGWTLTSSGVVTPPPVGGTGFTSQLLDGGPTFYVTYPEYLGTGQEVITFSGSNGIYQVSILYSYFNAINVLVDSSTFIVNITLNPDGTLTAVPQNDPTLVTTLTMTEVTANYYIVNFAEQGGTTYSDIWYFAPPADWISSGVPTTFTDNQNGTVTDNMTGLVWQQSGDSVSSWADALTYCDNLTLASSNWRLPSLSELRDLAIKNYDSPTTFNILFPSLYHQTYWTSTSVDSYFAYVVTFEDYPPLSYAPKENPGDALCVH